jgi:hypothetical protein
MEASDAVKVIEIGKFPKITLKEAENLRLYESFPVY